jgi:methionyl-tRNA formyltransferase
MIGEILNITEEGLFVSTGLGVLQVIELQMEGGRRLNKKDFFLSLSGFSGRVML